MVISFWSTSTFLETGQHADRVDADLVHRVAAFHDEQRQQAELAMRRPIFG